VVNEARNIMMGLQKQVIEFTDNCDLQYANRFVKVTEPKNVETINQLYNSFNLYPNPNNGNFTLQSLSSKEVRATVQLTDILGKTIVEQAFTNKAEISISDANCKGIYFIKVINEENKTIYTGKVIVY
jgi:DNA-directed RNA polymerase subunit F